MNPKTTDLKDRQAHSATNSETPPWRTTPVWEKSWGRFICPGAAPTTPTTPHSRQILTKTTRWRNEAPLPPAAGAASGGRGNQRSRRLRSWGVFPPPPVTGRVLIELGFLVAFVCLDSPPERCRATQARHDHDYLQGYWTKRFKKKMELPNIWQETLNSTTIDHQSS